jgi:hypothetical protein
LLDRAAARGVGATVGAARLAVSLLSVLALAGCNGSALVTVTATPSQDTFLAYRVALTSVELQTSSGKTALKVLPSGTTMDLSTLINVSEVVGVATASKATYTAATITLDYSNAQIIYDDGSVNGVALTPVGANGQALGQVSLTIDLDPADPLRIASKTTSRLAIEFNLQAMNRVNLSAKTVTVSPFVAASTLAIDSKTVRIRGALESANATDLQFTTNVMPFDGSVDGLGHLTVTPTDATTFEVNGTVSTGSAGMTQLAALSPGAFTVSYGTLTSTTTEKTETTLTDSASSTTTTSTAASDTASTTTVSTTSLVFSPTQVLAGSSVQGSGYDRVTGVVSARSGDTLTLEDATLVADDGTNSLISGTTLVDLGNNTAVTLFGQSTSDTHTLQQISVGSSIDAFGTVTTSGSTSATLDASAGRVRLDTSSASGLVNSSGTGVISLNLSKLGGRSVSAFDFTGSGAGASQYQVDTGDLSLTNATDASPIAVSGFTGVFGITSPNFTASALLDSTTLLAELVVDYGAGTAAPFVTYDSSSIDLDASNSNIGQRHQIEVGAQTVDIVGLSQDPLITPNSTAASNLFSIGHSSSGTIENFDTYDAFISKLQTELNGTTLVTGVTATGIYTVSTFAFEANSMTLFLND